jgi:hypothetical protein
MRFLVETDPSPSHNSARHLHEAHTSQWLLQSNEYKDWLNGLTRFIWLHGIPGAGKTVLASYIIDQVEGYTSTAPTESTAHAYYYCYFQRNQDETLPFMCWAISQLCRQLKEVPEELQKFYNRGIKPGYNDLFDILRTISTRFQRVYIIIDALDESQNRTAILNLLRHIATDYSFKTLHILATSRQERDIERKLQGLGPNISMSNALVDKDISRFIEAYMRNDSKLSHWPQTLREEIRQALIIGAKGMYTLQLSNYFVFDEPMQTNSS